MQSEAVWLDLIKTIAQTGDAPLLMAAFLGTMAYLVTHRVIYWFPHHEDVDAIRKKQIQTQREDLEVIRTEIRNRLDDITAAVEEIREHSRRHSSGS